MDTKWKKSKKIISFIVFFLGVSLTLGSLMDLGRSKPSGVRIWQMDKLLEEDYQQTGRFRTYIANRLENLLIMATGGSGLGDIWGYSSGAYYGYGYYGASHYEDYVNDVIEDYVIEDYNSATQWYASETTEVLEDSGIPYDSATTEPSIPPEALKNYLYELETLSEGYLDILYFFNDIEHLSSQDIASYKEMLEDCQNALEDYLESLETIVSGSYGNIKPLTEEQKQKIAQKYHDAIKGDKNLLYTVAYDGEVLYSNSDQLPADGSMTAPEGYNFILYFDGEKVRILKDGKELDVYGDGYYREDSDWYVPGYRNFQTDETAKKAAICIAAAKDPILYMEGSYGNGGSIQYDNGLYWMNYNLQSRRNLLAANFARLIAGVLLLALACLCRRSRGEALEGLARFQAKIWAEFKILLLLGVLLVSCRWRLYMIRETYYDLRSAIFYGGYYEDNFKNAVLTCLSWVPPLFWVILFWCIYLLWNDLRHNKKIWRHSLIAKLSRLYSARHMSQAISRKAVHRGRLAFAASILYGLLMLGCIVILTGITRRWQGSFPGIVLAALLGTAVFLVLLNRLGMKNMEMARDVEALSHRIDEIRKGNYNVFDHEKGTGDSGGEQEAEDLYKRTDFSAHSHDLENVLAQLEDISHGMANAVDEQMKSERMKVELIANVSHDIKTPLTSIISYVEFLKQEEGLPEHVKDYIRILDEKSQRLKNMVQDVFAVSKAASGELPMQMEALDFGKLLLQTIADMEEQIGGSAVTFRTQMPDTPVMILADGQRMYRVFQNLFQNAIKYSLDGSRVYVTLKTDGALAIASVKNTSRMELEKGRDFVERFARGDASRTDGGSGLGLSIAQSFTEACGGEFFWETDADLFVVKVSFHTL